MMSTKLEAAARQALENSQPSFMAPGWRFVRNEDITALREALTEQAAEQRPQNCGTGFCSCIECPYGTQQAAEPAKQCATPEQCKNTFCAPPCPGCKTAPTQQAAEPVAMRYRFHYPDDGSKPYRTSEWKYTQGPWDKIPGNARDVSALSLHEAPTQQPLTSWQRRQIIMSVKTVGEAIDMVEAIHNITRPTIPAPQLEAALAMIDKQALGKEGGAA